MGKREKHFEKVAEYKARFEKLFTEKIREMLSHGKLIKEAAIAYRELLEEREILEKNEKAFQSKIIKNLCSSVKICDFKNFFFVFLSCLFVAKK